MGCGASSRPNGHFQDDFSSIGPDNACVAKPEKSRIGRNSKNYSPERLPEGESDKRQSWPEGFVGAGAPGRALRQKSTGSDEEQKSELVKAKPSEAASMERNINPVKDSTLQEMDASKKKSDSDHQSGLPKYPRRQAGGEMSLNPAMLTIPSIVSQETLIDDTEPKQKKSFGDHGGSGSIDLVSTTHSSFRREQDLPLFGGEAAAQSVMSEDSSFADDSDQAPQMRSCTNHNTASKRPSDEQASGRISFSKFQHGAPRVSFDRRELYRDLEDPEEGLVVSNTSSFDGRPTFGRPSGGFFPSGGVLPQDLQRDPRPSFCGSEASDNLRRVRSMLVSAQPALGSFNSNRSSSRSTEMFSGDHDARPSFRSDIRGTREGFGQFSRTDSRQETRDRLTTDRRVDERQNSGHFSSEEMAAAASHNDNRHVDVTQNAENPNSSELGGDHDPDNGLPLLSMGAPGQPLPLLGGFDASDTDADRTEDTTAAGSSHGLHAPISSGMLTQFNQNDIPQQDGNLSQGTRSNAPDHPDVQMLNEQDPRPSFVGRSFNSNSQSKRRQVSNAGSGGSGRDFNLDARPSFSQDIQPLLSKNCRPSSFSCGSNQGDPESTSLSTTSPHSYTAADSTSGANSAEDTETATPNQMLPRRSSTAQSQVPPSQSDGAAAASQSGAAAGVSQSFSHGTAPLFIGETNSPVRERQTFHGAGTNRPSFHGSANRPSFNGRANRSFNGSQGGLQMSGNADARPSFVSTR